MIPVYMESQSPSFSAILPYTILYYWSLAMPATFLRACEATE